MRFNTPTLKSFLVASSIALAVPLAAQARPDMGEHFGGGRCDAEMRAHDGKGRHHGGPKMGMLRGLDLSDAQRDQIFELKHALVPELRAEMKVVRATRQALREMMENGSYDAAQVQQLTEQGAAAKARDGAGRAELTGEAAARAGCPCGVGRPEVGRRQAACLNPMGTAAYVAVPIDLSGASA